MYILIAMLYCLVIVTKVLTYIIEKPYAKEYMEKEVLKKDFLFCLTLIFFVTMIIINILNLIGRQTFNFNSIIVVLLLLGLEIINIPGKVYTGQEDELIVFGEKILKEDIKKVSIKNKSKYIKYKIETNKNNAYEFYSQQLIENLK